MASQYNKARETARETGEQAREKAETLFQRIKKHAPGPLGWVALLAVGGILATGTVITLIVLTPVFIFFSPILVPLGIILFLCTAGFLTAVGSAIGTVMAISWIYRYFKGKHPPGAEKIEYAMTRIHDTAEQVKHKARDLGGQA
ncbi:hypothetical protein KP509_25G017900 [Ceratopteris richardii]|uniref:Oleosin n=1 Tax=Ceratopteris richardii TaxID=49495 RepID=A0A8T2RQ34_CERRI|nr:hypothetical protein KP509_25G017900 [Ceratopteris richardii]